MRRSSEMLNTQHLTNTARPRWQIFVGGIAQTSSVFQSSSSAGAMVSWFYQRQRNSRCGEWFIENKGPFALTLFYVRKRPLFLMINLNQYLNRYTHVFTSLLMCRDAQDTNHRHHRNKTVNELFPQLLDCSHTSKPETPWQKETKLSPNTVTPSSVLQRTKNI